MKRKIRKNGVAWRERVRNDPRQGSGGGEGGGEKRGWRKEGALPDETGGFSLLLHQPGSHFLSSWANVTN